MNQPAYRIPLSWALNDELDRCKEWIEAALLYSSNSHTFLQVKQMVLDGEATLWSTENGVIITCISNLPNLRMMQLWLMGGSYQEVLEQVYDKIEAHARDQQCQQMFINGRKGWERRLAPLGYKPTSVILNKEL